MTTTVSSITGSRSSLGPLTTEFTVPQECTIFAAQELNDGSINGFWAAQGCSDYTVVDTATCWPSVDASVSIPEPPLLGFGFYSPGYVCPSGWKTACIAANLDNGSPSPVLSPEISFDFQFPLNPGETAVGCCPSSMSCHGGGNAVQTCRSEVDSGSFQIGFCGSTGYDGLTSLTVPGDLFYGTQASWSSSSAYIYAPLIQMNWKASDLSPTQSQTSQTPDPQTLVQSPSPATTAPSSTPSSQPTTIQNDSSSGLSNGGKIAVGVAVPLGVLAICFIAICFWLRSRRRKQTHAPVVLPEQRGIEESKRGGYHEAGQYSPGIQLDSKTAPQELSSSRSVVAGRHELMGSTGRSLRRSAG